jgi:ABC-type amino acid transport substrate-binding protein
LKELNLKKNLNKHLMTIEDMKGGPVRVGMGTVYMERLKKNKEVSMN